MNAKISNALGLLFGLEKHPTKGKDEIMTLALQEEEFDPAKLITPSPNPAEELGLGWHKTFKWTNTKEIKFKVCAGEDQMFDESESESESDNSESIDTLKSSIDP